MESSVPHCPTLIPAALGENLHSCSSVSISLCHQIQPSSSWSRYHFHQGTVASWTCGTLWLCLLPSAFHHLATRLCAGSLPLQHRQGDCCLWPPLLLSLCQHLEAPHCSEGLAASEQCVCEHIMQCEPVEGWCLCCQPPLKPGQGLLCGTQRTAMLCLSPSSQDPPVQPSPGFAAWGAAHSTRVKRGIRTNPSVCLPC